MKSLIIELCGMHDNLLIINIANVGKFVSRQFLKSFVDYIHEIIYNSKRTLKKLSIFHQQTSSIKVLKNAFYLITTIAKNR